MNAPDNTNATRPIKPSNSNGSAVALAPSEAQNSVDLSTHLTKGPYQSYGNVPPEMWVPTFDGPRGEIGDYVDSFRHNFVKCDVCGSSSPGANVTSDEPVPADADETVPAVCSVELVEFIETPTDDYLRTGGRAGPAEAPSLPATAMVITRIPSSEIVQVQAAAHEAP